MTDDQVITALVTWLARVTATTVIRDHQGGDRPVTPYVMVNFTGRAPIHAHERTILFDDFDTGEDVPNTAGEFPAVTARPLIDTEWRFSVHAFGSSPTDILGPVQSALKLTQVMEAAFPDLVVASTSQVRNVPEWVQNEWEPRANMDVFVRGLSRDGFEIDVISDIPVSVGSLTP